MSKAGVEFLKPVLGRVRLDVYAVKGAGGRIACVREPLRPSFVEAHLSGGQAVGVYGVLEGQDTCKISVIDLDDHVPEGGGGAGVGWPEMVLKARGIMAATEREGVICHPFRSRGGRGIHLFALWDEPQDCYSVRQFWERIVGVVGLSSGSSGVACGRVEIFPKQNKVAVGKVGCQVWLPFSGKSGVMVMEGLGAWPTLGAGFVDDGTVLGLADVLDLGLQWVKSAPVPVVEKPVLEPGTGLISGDLKILADKLEFIGFDQGGDYSYDRWLQVGFAIHHETSGGSDGLELWERWSARGAGYFTGACDHKWQTMGSGSGSEVVTGRTLGVLAREGGWVEDLRPAFAEIVEELGGDVGGVMEDSETADALGSVAVADCERGVRRFDDGSICFASPSDYYTIAAQVLSELFSWEKEVCLRLVQGCWYMFDGVCYREMAREDLEARVSLFLRRCFKRVKDGKKVVTVPFDPNMKSVAEVMAAIKAICLIDCGGSGVVVREGDWFKVGGGVERRGSFVCAQDGLIELDSGEVIGHTGAYFTTVCLPFRLADMGRGCPRWTTFLEETWPDSEGVSGACSREGLAEVFGYILDGSLAYEKFFLIQGKKRTGKGTIAKVLRLLLGPEAVAGMEMGSLGTSFGLESLIGKRLGVFPDLRNGSGGSGTIWALERMLSVVSKDGNVVPRKFKSDWQGVLDARILMLTNEIPLFGDRSEALLSRVLCFRTDNSFYEREDFGLIDKLEAELAGIFAWSLAGLRRLKARGRFVQNEAGKRIRKEMQTYSNPVKCFVKDCLVKKEGGLLSKRTIFTAFEEWAADNGCTEMRFAYFVRDLEKVFDDSKFKVKSHYIKNPNAPDKRMYVYSGIALKEY